MYQIIYHNEINIFDYVNQQLTKSTRLDGKNKYNVKTN